MILCSRSARSEPAGSGTDPSRAGLAVFTICSNNYLPRARVLLQSVRRQHPDATLFLCLADRPDPEAVARQIDGQFEIVPIDDLGIPGMPEFTFRYDIMELNTAVKPWMILFLLEQRGFDSVLYFDPDILVLAPLAGVLALLAGGASLVVTPHCLAPNERESGPEDRIFLLAGVFNLGFLAVGNCPEARRVIRWWARRLRWECINDQAAGLFVDQRFADLAPCLAPALRISHDATLNVAYWNLAQRNLTRSDEGWNVDGRPLGFFHFSGFDVSDPDRLSRHSQEFGAPLAPALRSLLTHYTVLLDACDDAVAPPYAFGRFASGAPVTDGLRRIFRDRHRAWSGDPFDTYERHLAMPAAEPGSGPLLVTNLLHAIHDRSATLKLQFDLTQPAGVAAFFTWFVRAGGQEHGLDPRLVHPVAEQLDRSLPRKPVGGRADGRDAGADVTVAGYLTTPNGTGEAARMTLRCLQAAGLRAEAVDLPPGIAVPRPDTSCAAALRPAGRASIEILHVNADQLVHVVDAHGDRLAPDAHRIAVPFWETERLPSIWAQAFDRVHEIWAPSRFVQLALWRTLNRPICHMPLAVAPPFREADGRARFGLPRQAFLFFVAFDFLSYVDRKNPGAAIAAFRLAFVGKEEAMLVIKTSNGDLAPQALAALEEAIGGDRRITLIDATLDRQELMRLFCACDCLVSLHRSEGFGLLVAEAMMLGIPVIGTDYGGTTDLLSEATGFPVQFRMIPIASGAYPHGEGQVWADPDIGHAAWLMRRLVRRPGVARSRVAAAGPHVISVNGTEAVGIRQRARLREIARAMR